MILSLAAIVLAAPPARTRRAAPIEQEFSIDGEQVKDAHKFVISKGRQIDWVFKLPTGTVWDNCVKEVGKPCSITIALTNTRPDKVTLSACFVRWIEGDNSPKRVTIIANDDFRDTGEVEFEIITEPVESGLKELFHDYDPPNLILRTKTRPTAECRSVTDPNYKMWDGTQAVNNRAGSFRLWIADWRDWEVQSRVRNTYNCAVAIRDGCERLVIDRCSGSVVIRKYFSPRRKDWLSIKRSGNRYTITSQRFGGYVEVDINTRHERTPGRQICGWSGCRTVWHSRTIKWMDIRMFAPSSDWGWVDDAFNEKTVSRTRGVCGTFDSDRTDDTSINNAINTFSVRHGQSLFNPSYKMPKPCVTKEMPVIDPAECTVPQVPYSTPIISTIDSESVVASIKVAQATDSDDGRLNYPFTPGETPEQQERSEAFTLKARSFCVGKLKDTLAWTECLVSGKTDEEMEEYITECVSDVLWQANEFAFEPNEEGVYEGFEHEWLAQATYNTMVSDCIQQGAANPKMSVLHCAKEGVGCTTHCFEGNQANCTCIGTCVAEPIDPTNQFADLTQNVCPNDCNKDNNQMIDGEMVTPGACHTNLENKRVCVCNQHFDGFDCSQRKDDGIDISNIFPHGCQTNLDRACPSDIAISGDDLVEVDPGQAKCRWYKQDTPGVGEYEVFAIEEATYIPANIYRCPLPENQDREPGTSTVEQWRVDLSLDGGKHYSKHPLVFSFYSSVCFECHEGGNCELKPESCFIKDTCYAAGQKKITSGSACAVCDPLKSATDWTIDDTIPDCGILLDTLPWLGRSITVSEDTVGGTHLDGLDQQFTTINGNGRSFLRWSVQQDGGETGTFSIRSRDSGQSAFLVLEKPVNFEAKSSYMLTITVKGETSEDSMDVSVVVRDADESTELSVSYPGDVSWVTIDENQPAMDTGALVSFNDPDTEGDFADVTIGLTGAYASLFDLKPIAGSATTMALWTSGPLNAEELEGIHTVKVVATTPSDQQGVSKDLSFRVNDLPEPPVKIVLAPEAVSESVPVDDVAAKIQVQDPDAGSSVVSVEIKSQTPPGLFKIDPETPTNLLVAAMLDYAALTQKGSAFAYVELDLEVTDNDGLTLSQKVKLKVDDANTAPTDVTIINEDTGALVSSLPESTVQGSTVGSLVATDGDANDKHMFELCALTDKSSCTDERIALGFPEYPLQISGNKLILHRSLDYEKADGKELNFYLRAIDNQMCTGIGVIKHCGLSSPWIKQRITVTDSEDVPRDFKIALDAASNFVAPVPIGDISLLGVIEGVDGNGVQIGVISGNDQDPNQSFTLSILESDTPFSVGTTTCQTESEQTVCSAPLILDGQVDYESNRLSGDSSSFKITIVGTPSDSSVSAGQEEVRIHVVPVNEAPNAIFVVYADDSMASGTNVEAEIGRPAVGQLLADDPDLCRSSGADCDGFSDADEFKFEKVSGASELSLSDSCSQFFSNAARSGDAACTLLIGESTLGAMLSITIKVTDQDNLSKEVTFKVEVVQAKLTVQLLGSDDLPAKSVPEYDGNDYSDPGLKLIIKGWDKPSAPQPELYGKSASVFQLGAPEHLSGQRRDAGVTDWKVSVMVAEPARLDFEESPETTLIIQLKGESWKWALSVTDTLVESPRVELCGSPEGCTMCATSCNLAVLRTATILEPSMHLVVKGGRGDEWTFDQDELGSLVRLAKEGTLSLIQSAAAASVNAETKAKFSRSVTSDGGSTIPFTLVVSVVCPANAKGPTCSTFVTEAPDDVIDAEESSASSSMSSGSVAALVIGLIVLVALLIGVIMWKINKDRKDMEVIDGLDEGLTRQPLFVSGQSNPMYGWYHPQQNKSDAYAELSAARSGAFVVRDCDERDPQDAAFVMHVKTPKAVIVDEYITCGNGTYEIMEPNQPKFNSIPQLVDYYGRPSQQDLPFQLAIDNPMYGMFAGAEELYDNSAIKNSLEVQDAPMLPVKIVSSTGI